MSAKPSCRMLLAENDPAHAGAIRKAFEATGQACDIQVVGTLKEYREADRKSVV